MNQQKPPLDNDGVVFPEKINAPIHIKFDQETKDFILSLQKSNFNHVNRSLGIMAVICVAFLFFLAVILAMWSWSQGVISLIHQKGVQGQSTAQIEGIRSSSLRSLIEDDLKKKISSAESFSSAASHVLFTRERIVLTCQYGLGKTLKQKIAAGEKRIDARIALENATSNADVLYKDNGEIQDKVSAFYDFDKSVNDVCAPNSPPKEAWESRQAEIAHLMEKSIAKDKEQLRNLDQKGQ